MESEDFVNQMKGEKQEEFVIAQAEGREIAKSPEKDEQTEIEEKQEDDQV